MIPNYMLRRLFLPGGVRLCKPPEVTKDAGKCLTCGKPVFEKRLLGVFQLDGIYVKGDVYHYACKPKEEFTAGAWRKVDAHLMVCRGNLPQEEYRYWIGYRQQQSTYAMCRACRTSQYTSAQREAHFKDEKVWVGGQNCAVRLVAAYKQMLLNPICLVCKKNRFGHTKWGVPICEQASCEQAWKFDEIRWMDLERCLLDQRKRAILLKKAKLNDLAIVAMADDKPTSRIYCASCNMFWDNKAHEEMHRLRNVGMVYSDDPEPME